VPTALPDASGQAHIRGRRERRQMLSIRSMRPSCCAVVIASATSRHVSLGRDERARRGLDARDLWVPRASRGSSLRDTAPRTETPLILRSATSTESRMERCDIALRRRDGHCARGRPPQAERDVVCSSARISARHPRAPGLARLERCMSSPICGPDDAETAPCDQADIGRAADSRADLGQPRPQGAWLSAASRGRSKKPQLTLHGMDEARNSRRSPLAVWPAPLPRATSRHPSPRACARVAAMIVRCSGRPYSPAATGARGASGAGW
jgi:hypothetical protein